MTGAGRTKTVAKHEPTQNAPSEIFTLHLENLETSFLSVMKQIEDFIERKLKDEINKQPPLERMPLNVKGRLYTLDSGHGAFLLRIEPGGQSHGAKVVTLLIRWCDLYIMAFYVEGVWYHYNDFDTQMIPPRTQLSYNPRSAVGIIKLPIGSSYGSIGGFNIKVGKPAFTHCILTLGKLSTLHKNAEGIKKLRSGPLSFPTITISEAIRFALWRDWVKVNIVKEVDTAVPKEHNKYFNHWSDISDAVVNGTPWDKLEEHDLVKKLCIIKRSEDIKPEKVKWKASSSRSKNK